MVFAAGDTIARAQQLDLVDLNLTDPGAVSSSSSSVETARVSEGVAELPDAPGTELMEQTTTQTVPATANGQAAPVTTGEPQQTKRILGIMPNFSSVSADTKLPPLSPKDKFVLAAKNSFDYSSFIIAAIQSGISFADDSYPEFGEGAEGYGQYFWHTLVDTADENFMVSGLFPVIFHQDPRFYTLGHGGAGKRALYAASRVLISRTDDGNKMFNFSEIIGSGSAAGISSLYYPEEYRTWTKVGQKWLTSDIIDGANFVFKEFWPDINKHVFRSHGGGPLDKDN